MCLLLAYASLLAIVFLIIRMILPELAECIGLLIQEAIPLLQRLNTMLNETVDLSQILSSSGIALTDGSINWRELVTDIVNWLVCGRGGVMGSVVSLFSALISSVFTLFVSVTFFPFTCCWASAGWAGRSIRC